ncbi:hypothetical protein [Asanoa siamensis]|uniref:Uncharacterized protein n=1 Tax=Asanoa siamensis TaxID=926357 RepID=A0ABQ4CV26_9ACTN|nr:hypothetical protein [Asanoa siamensis]GIF75129.1 hypothetical protein Asi02nite_46470 [Asanoa siamensis]
MLTFEVVLWRTVLVGVYVSERGVKIRHVTRTRVVPWNRVTRVWAGQAAGFDAWQIWVSTSDPDRDVETPIWRRQAWTWRRHWTLHRNRVYLSPDEFAATLAALRSGQAVSP